MPPAAVQFRVQSELERVVELTYEFHIHTHMTNENGNRELNRSQAARDNYRVLVLGVEKVSLSIIDMAPTKKPQKAAKKEKIFHPESRKAGQLARKQLRKSKLAGQASKRGKLHSSKGKSSSMRNRSNLIRNQKKKKKN